MKNKFDLNKVAKRIRPVLEASLILIGNEAKNHFVGSFRLQGFQDVNVDKWKKRKNPERKGRGSKKSAAELGTVRSVKAGRAILVKTGDLRRSIRRESLNKARLSVTIATDLPYARVHNDGLTINVAGRTGSGTITTKVRGSARFENGRFTRGRAKTLKIAGKEYTTGPYSINMPKRQFIGHSFTMNEKIKKTITKQINNLFKK